MRLKALKNLDIKQVTRIYILLVLTKGEPKKGKTKNATFAVSSACELLRASISPSSRRVSGSLMLTADKPYWYIGRVLG